MSEGVAETQRRAGIQLIGKEEGLKVFDELVRGCLEGGMTEDLKMSEYASTKEMPTVIAYQKINWEIVRRAFVLPPPIFSHVMPIEDKADQSGTSPLGHPSLGHLSFKDVPPLVDLAIKKSIHRILGPQSIPEDVPMLDLGFDSLGVVELRQLLSSSLDIKIPPTALFDYPTLRELKKFLVDTVAKTQNIILTNEAVIQDVSRESHSVPKQLGQTSGSGEVIAITGMACRFPKSRSLSQFWDNLYGGVDCMSPIPKERWDIDEFYDPNPDIPASMYVKEAGFCSDLELFDHRFFNISQVEACSMDPQQRVFLEVGYEALLDAGLTSIQPGGRRTGTDPTQLTASEHSSFFSASFMNTTGVFVGVCLPDWTYSLDMKSVKLHTGTGLVPSLVSNRFSYCFGFKGPSLSIDTACSASLVALDIACDKLRNGDCTYAIVGGVQLNLSPFPFMAFCKARMLSPSGRSRTFDASADGYGRGEGCGAVVLERLTQSEYRKSICSSPSRRGEQKEEDGRRGREEGKGENTTRRLWGVVKGSAIGHDGKGVNLVAPNGSSQQKVIRRAMSEIISDNPTSSLIGYFETHGTGTALGDPIEFSAIQAVFRKDKHTVSDSRPPTSDSRPLILGAVKTNIGHLEGAAGIAGFIKTVLSLSQRVAPPFNHFKSLNTNIECDSEFNYIIPTEPVPIALTLPNPSVSIDQNNRTPSYDGEAFGCVSSFGFGGALAHAVISAPDLRNHSISRSLNGPSFEKQLVFVFTGQGSQYFGIWHDLFDREPSFRQSIIEIADVVRPLLNGIDLKDFIFQSSSNNESAFQSSIDNRGKE